MSCSDDEVLSYSKLLLIKNSFPTPATGSCSVSLSARLKQSLQLSVTIQVALGCNQTTFCLLVSLDLSQVHFSLQHIFFVLFYSEESEEYQHQCEIPNSHLLPFSHDSLSHDSQKHMDNRNIFRL